MNDIDNLVSTASSQALVENPTAATSSAFNISIVSDASKSYDTLDGMLEKAGKVIQESVITPATKIFIAEKDEKSNGSVTEKNPPKPTYPKDVPYANRPTIAPAALGEVSVGTLLGKTNGKLHHECDFSINLKMNVCGKTIDVFSKNIKAVFDANLQSLLEAKIPFLGHILNIFKTLKSWFDTIMSYINKINMFIKCMTDLIKSTVDFITQLATLPARLLGQITGCLSGLRNLLKSSVENLLNNGILKQMSQGVAGMVGQVNAAKTQFGNSVNTAKNALNVKTTTDKIKGSYQTSTDNFSGELNKWQKPDIKVNTINDYVQMSNIGALKPTFQLP